MIKLMFKEFDELFFFIIKVFCLNLIEKVMIVINNRIVYENCLVN